MKANYKKVVDKAISHAEIESEIKMLQINLFSRILVYYYRIALNVISYTLISKQPFYQKIQVCNTFIVEIQTTKTFDCKITIYGLAADGKPLTLIDTASEIDYTIFYSNTLFLIFLTTILADEKMEAYVKNEFTSDKTPTVMLDDDLCVSMMENSLGSDVTRQIVSTGDVIKKGKFQKLSESKGHYLVDDRINIEKKQQYVSLELLWNCFSLFC